jgi:hypothetical protein
MIVCGSAGVGKSEFIKAVKYVLQDLCLIACPTAKAGFSIGGYTLHILLKLPTSNLN